MFSELHLGNKADSVFLLVGANSCSTLYLDLSGGSGNRINRSSQLPITLTHLKPKQTHEVNPRPMYTVCITIQFLGLHTSLLSVTALIPFFPTSSAQDINLKYLINHGSKTGLQINASPDYWG